MNQSDDEVSSDQEYRATSELRGAFCPECGSVAGGKVSMNTDLYWCGNDDCSNQWNPAEVEECIECGDPATGSAVICHTCWTEGKSDDE